MANVTANGPEGITLNRPRVTTEPATRAAKVPRTERNAVTARNDCRRA